VKKKLLILVDGSYYLYRAYHVPALRALRNSRGEPTGAIYGTINMLRKLLQDYKPDYFAVIFDAKGKNFRHGIFPEYKAHRPPMPDELRAQIAPLIEAIPALGLPMLRIAGVEADDVIGTLAERAAREGLSVVVSTGDKDMAQLVGPRCRMVNFVGTVFDAAAIEARWGVPPSEMRLLLSWMGDASDGLPGVKGYGPKKSIVHALAGEVGDDMTYELAGLATVLEELLFKNGGPAW